VSTVTNGVMLFEIVLKPLKNQCAGFVGIVERTQWDEVVKMNFALKQNALMYVCLLIIYRYYNLIGKMNSLYIQCGSSQRKISNGCPSCLHVRNPQRCATCDIVGHRASQCPDNWRRFWSTTTTVLIIYFYK
jgi:hypothetical protein